MKGHGMMDGCCAADALDEAYLPEDALTIHCYENESQGGGRCRDAASNEATAASRRDRRRLRFRQKRSAVVGSEQRTTALIEVLDEQFAHVRDGRSPAVFAVRHAHGTPWGRQFVLHRSLLIACILTGVANCPVEIPEDSVKALHTVDQLHHTHSLMERLIIHIKPPGVVIPGLRIFWWRAAPNGALIAVNEHTGRMLASAAPSGRIAEAVQVLRGMLNILRNCATRVLLAQPEEAREYQLVTAPSGPADLLPGTSLQDTDPDYIDFLQLAEADAFEEPDRVLTTAEFVEAVQRWAVDASVSPWLTTHVVVLNKAGSFALPRGGRSRAGGGGVASGNPVHFRYSLDAECPDNQAPEEGFIHSHSAELEAQTSLEETGHSGAMVVTVQLHANEPLSRETQAFPVCLLPFSLETGTLREAHLVFRRALWFLQKLEALQAAAGGAAGVAAASPVAARAPASFAPLKPATTSASVPEYPPPPRPPPATAARLAPMAPPELPPARRSAAERPQERHVTMGAPPASPASPGRTGGLKSSLALQTLSRMRSIKDGTADAFPVNSMFVG